MESSYGCSEHQASELGMISWYPISYYEQIDDNLMTRLPSWFHNFISPVYKIPSEKTNYKSLPEYSTNIEQINKISLPLAYPCHLHGNCCVVPGNEIEKISLLEKRWCSTIKAHRATFYRDKIFVGSLARKTTPNDLVRFFKRFGKVIEAKVIVDFDGNSKGYGFVSFASEDTVKSILNLGAIYMEKKRIAVAYAIRKKHDDEN